MGRKREKSRAGGFVYHFGACWIGPQRWHIEFVDGDVEATFAKKDVGGGIIEFGRTIWHGNDNLIRINAALLLTRHPEEILNTLVHEIGHVALEGKFSKCDTDLSETQVEHILCALDSFIGQALVTLGLVNEHAFDGVRQAYLDYLARRKGDNGDIPAKGQPDSKLLQGQQGESEPRRDGAASGAKAQ